MSASGWIQTFMTAHWRQFAWMRRHLLQRSMHMQLQQPINNQCCISCAHDSLMTFLLSCRQKRSNHIKEQSNTRLCPFDPGQLRLELSSEHFLPETSFRRVDRALVAFTHFSLVCWHCTDEHHLHGSPLNVAVMVISGGKDCHGCCH